jgi:hypothetical protein
MDRLYLNYQPSIISTINTDTTTVIGSNLIKPSNNTFIGLGLYYPSSVNPLAIMYNLINITITRKNIGVIIGAVLSWISILTLIVGVLAGPLMDKKLSLLTA